MLTAKELLLNNDQELINNFREILIKTASLLKYLGVSVVAFHDKNLVDFSKLSVPLKKSAMQDAQNYYNLLSETELTRNEDENLSEISTPGQSVWYALQKTKMRPASDLFSLLSYDDAIEVYSSEDIQVWRNLKFWEVCSYSLEEMYCYTWQERYHRDDGAINKILTLIKNFSPTSPTSIPCNINNLLEEKFSKNKFKIDVTHEILSPLLSYNTNNIAGFIVVSKVKLLSN